jgi:hypothetical protein
MSASNGVPLMNVFFTVDVEIWCGGWDSLDENFPEAFQRYVYGPTRQGDFALPFKLQVLNDHGLAAVFFVEPLFSTRFGTGPLEEIIDLIQSAGHEVQLHLHTEWVDEARPPLLPGIQGKRQFLRNFTQNEQTVLIAKGLDLLSAAGVGRLAAFRAGSFGFNADTLQALAKTGIKFDSSYNLCQFGSDSGVSPDCYLHQPTYVNGVFEYPMTVFRDRPGHFRHTQLGACSYSELTSMLWQALNNEWDTFVILSHNFELLNAAKNRPDPVVVRRFVKLCNFLDRHRKSFVTRGFNRLQPVSVIRQPSPLRSNVLRSGLRVVEQMWRRRYG